MRQLRVQFCILFLLAGCSSLSGRVKDYSIDYSVSMEQFSNEQILVNILRAKHQQPLHFAELGQINGSLQSAGQVNASIPFGKYVSEAKSANTVGSQITFASSPTFNTSPLDTQAFTVAMAQPMDTTYFAYQWQAADDLDMKRLLLYVFVDSVENADTRQLVGKRLIRNDQTGELGASEFSSFVDLWMSHNIEFKLVNVLSPLGDPFCIGPKQVTMADVVAFSKEPSIHVGKAPQGATCDHKTPAYQLEHLSQNQLALCAPGEDVKEILMALNPSKSPASRFSSGKAPTASERERNGGQLFFSEVLKATSIASARPPAATGGGLSAPPMSAQPPPSTSLVGLFSEEQCSQSEIHRDDGGAATQELKFHLRSPNEVFYYLGRVLASRSRAMFLSAGARGGTVFAVRSDETGDSDSDSGWNLPHQAQKDGSKDSPEIVVTYNSHTYWIEGRKGPTDYTLKIFAMLSEMVNSSKLSSDIPTIKQVQVIP